MVTVNSTFTKLSLLQVLISQATPLFIYRHKMKEFALDLELLDLSVEEFFDIFLNNAEFLTLYHTKRGDSDLQIGPWTTAPEGRQQRILRYSVPNAANAFIRKFTGDATQIKEIQLQHFTPEGELVLFTTTLFEKSSLVDFDCHAEWRVRPLKSQKGCVCLIKVQNEYKRALFKDTIENYVKDETQKSFKMWLQLAQEQAAKYLASKPMERETEAESGESGEEEGDHIHSPSTSTSSRVSHRAPEKSEKTKISLPPPPLVGAESSDEEWAEEDEDEDEDGKDKNKNKNKAKDKDKDEKQQITHLPLRPPFHAHARSRTSPRQAGTNNNNNNLKRHFDVGDEDAQLELEDDDHEDLFVDSSDELFTLTSSSSLLPPPPGGASREASSPGDDSLVVVDSRLALLEASCRSLEQEVGRLNQMLIHAQCRIVNLEHISHHPTPTTFIPAPVNEQMEQLVRDLHRRVSHLEQRLHHQAQTQTQAQAQAPPHPLPSDRKSVV